MSQRTAGETAHVAIIVTHYKSVPALEASLVAIRDVADPGRTEVVVADSEVQPGTEEAVRAILPGTNFIGFADDVGYAVSVNAGIQATSAPYVLVINADVRIAEGTVEKLVAALEADPSLGLVAPILRYDDGALQDSAFRFHRPTTILHRRTMVGGTAWGRAALRKFTEPSRVVERAIGDPEAAPVETDWVLGAAMMVRRAALEEVGPPDTRYWMYFEDVDWCLRMWHAGCRVAVVPGAEAFHTYGRASRGKGPRALLTNQMARVHVRSAVKFFLAHGLRPTRSPRKGPSRPWRRPAETTVGS
ncbi:glycosyltransferase family 2 protein [Blastococcus montanus]|uniref:glycosyltransferase family 2 protein n=1 Tax=Blastococcus montanus TaxID=3144973 RepID=UPI00320834BD